MTKMQTNLNDSESKLDEARAAAKEAAANVGTKVNAMVDSATSAVGSALERGAERAPEGLASKLSSTANYLERADGRSLSGDITQVVKDHPKAAIATGLGIGYLIAKAIKR